MAQNEKEIITKVMLEKVSGGSGFTYCIHCRKCKAPLPVGEQDPELIERREFRGVIQCKACGTLNEYHIILTPDEAIEKVEAP